VFVKPVNEHNGAVANGKDNDGALCRAYNARRVAEAAGGRAGGRADGRARIVLHHSAFTRRAK